MLAILLFLYELPEPPDLGQQRGDVDAGVGDEVLLFFDAIAAYYISITVVDIE